MDNYPVVAKIQQFYLGRSELGNKLAIQFEGGHLQITGTRLEERAVPFN